MNCPVCGSPEEVPVEVVLVLRGYVDMSRKKLAFLPAHIEHVRAQIENENVVIDAWLKQVQS